MTNHPSPVPVATAPAAYSASTLLTLAEIAEMLGRDPKTIKTWRAAGRWAHPVQDAAGRRAWRVSVTDLVATGDLDKSQVANVETELAARRESRDSRELREQVIRLEEQLAAAHALATERAATIALLTGLLRHGDAA